jgi:hypothetical protein
VVLTDLRAKNYKSEHIKDLDTHTISYPGYHPNTDNDEIHMAFQNQYIFSKKEDESASTPSSKALQNYVFKNHLYYVLLHTAPTIQSGFEFSDWVILFAVGISPQSGNLIAAIANQACHNLCD